MRLKGIVTQRRFYGPPNYGETPKTDHLVTVPIFKLDKAIVPCDLPDFDNGKRDNGAPVRVLQIQSQAGRPPAKRPRILSGIIRHSAIGPEFLDYVVVVP